MSYNRESREQRHDPRKDALNAMRADLKRHFMGADDEWVNKLSEAQEILDNQSSPTEDRKVFTPCEKCGGVFSNVPGHNQCTCKNNKDNLDEKDNSDSSLPADTDN